MKQVLQDLRTGETRVVDAPAPAPAAGQVLVRTRCSLISAGTERMLVQFGKAGWLAKARQQPDKVRMVLDKIRTDGIVPTLNSVRNKLNAPLAPGYCNVGIVAATGNGVTAFRPGERVVSNGKHAEVVSVPTNLCAAVPANVSDEEAAFTVIGAIALQGIRLVQPTLGERVVVTGLGLIGLITVQLLRAHGCRVLGIDYDPARLNLARRFGAEVVDLSAGEDPVGAANAFSRGVGVDAVIITASSRSSEPMHQAAVMCRKRGRIVLVGVTGLELSRADFYEKELTFQVSCSYGPGRYDSAYEERGHDYPLAFVRWTEQRNFEATLDMMADGRLDVKPLVSHRFPVDDAARAYELIAANAPSLGIVLEYRGDDPAPASRRTVELARAAVPTTGRAAVSFIGSGNYATAVLIPAFKAAPARLRSVASASGVTGLHAAQRFGFEQTTTDTASLLADPDTDAVVITTRHDTHAALVVQSLAAGKHVFVEKPLCLTLDELRAVEDAARASGRVLTVGFNRRFAPHVVRMKALLSGLREPKAFVMSVNAGAVPANHWTQDREIGGGRIVGEACHFIDLLRHLAGCGIVRVQAAALASAARNAGPADTATITLHFADGSIGTVHYFANGHKSFPKERLEAFAGGRILRLDNFRTLDGHGWSGFRRMRLWQQDKGQRACAAAFVAAVEAGSGPPVPLDEVLQ